MRENKKRKQKKSSKLIIVGVTSVLCGTYLGYYEPPHPPYSVAAFNYDDTLGESSAFNYDYSR